jgi:predicted ATPase/DNA-binding SARP family transcriptional activator
VSVRIGILGPLELRDEAGQPLRLGGPRVRALLIRLALDAGRTVSAGQLAGDLWDGDGPGESGNALQALVSRLRQATGAACIEYRDGGYRLALGPRQVDAGEFEWLVSQGRAAIAGGQPERGAGLLGQALGLWRGPALVDAADAPFAAGPATRLEELRLAVAEDRIEAGLGLGCGPELVPEAEELATRHPLRERLRGQLMRALYQAGRPGDALAVYEDTRRLLADQLGVDPSPGLAAVHLAVLRADPALGVPAPALSAPASGVPAQLRTGPAQGGRAQGGPAQGGPAPGGPAPGGPAPGGTSPAAAPAPGAPARPPGSRLPAQLTSFVGREAELDQVAARLGSARLVTLTGPGGAGKTRLALEASARLAGQAPDGIWFIPLAPVRDALDVPQAVLAALGAEAGWAADAVRLAVVPPADRLADVLAIRDLLLILDNCEHLTGAVAQLAGQVLAAAPGVRILATSREPLGVTGETLCPVPSLPVPPDGAAPAQARRYAAVALLAERAAAVRPGFAVDEITVAPVVQICRALDGSPLAIELAAARLRSLTPAQVAARLDDRFRLLGRGSPAALPRHQTLRAIVDWSWDLLGGAERAVLRRLSVFSGGATPDAAEQVCTLGSDPEPIIDVIAALVDKSLVVADGAGDVRYRLLETVRAYAAERLAEAGERDAARAAHAGYFLRLAERAEPALRGPDQLVWLARLATEHDNCTAALRDAIARGDAGLGLRLVAALAWFWIMRDYEAEAAQWAIAVRDLAGPQPPDGLANEYALAQIVAAVGEVSAARDRAAEQLRPGSPLVTALRTAVSAPRPGTVHPLLLLAAPMLAFFTGDQQAAEQQLGRLAGHPDPWVRAAQQAIRGHLAMNNGQLDVAADGLSGGYAGFREVGDRWGLIVSLSGLGEVALARDDPAEAIRILEEARGLAADGLHANFGDMMLIPLARARARLGEVAQARADLQRGAGIAGRIGEKDDEVSGYLALADLARRAGDGAEAGRHAGRALEIAEAHRDRPGMGAWVATVYSVLGALAEEGGDLDTATRWHRQALDVAGRQGVVFLPNNPTLARLVEGWAALAAARREPAAAAERLGLAHTLHGFKDVASLEVARAERAATAALGPAAFAAAYARGQRRTREDALALATEPAAMLRAADGTATSPTEN